MEYISERITNISELEKTLELLNIKSQLIKQSGYHFESASELTSLLYLQTGATKAAIIRR